MVSADTILTISPVVPDNGTSGYKLAIRSDMEALRASGYSVHALCLHDGTTASQRDARSPSLVRVRAKKGGRLRRSLRGLFSLVPAAAERYYVRGLIEALDRTAPHQPVAIIIQDVPLSGWIPLLRRRYPGVPIVLRSHNFMAPIARAQEMDAGLLRPLFMVERWKWERLERQGVLNADAVWCISMHEAVEMQRAYPGREISYAPVAIDISRYKSLPTCGGQPRTFCHLGTLDLKKAPGLLWFIRSVWPRVLSVAPDATLLVGGRQARSVPIDGVNVRYVGEIGDDRDLLGLCRYFVNPQHVGGGIKLKSLTALAAGRVLLSTRNGVAGLSVRDEYEYMALEQWDDTAWWSRVLRDEEYTCRIAAAGRSWVEAAHGRAVCHASIGRLMETLFMHREQ
jgi:hypothetical protein